MSMYAKNGRLKDLDWAEFKMRKYSNARQEERGDEMHFSYRSIHCSVAAEQGCALAWYSIEEQLHFAITTAVSLLEISTRE